MHISSTRSITYMFLSACCFTAMNGIVKHIDHLPVFELVFFRALGSALLCWMVLYRKKISPIGKNPRLLFFRASAGLISMALFFKAIHIMPIASAVTLRYISPFFAAMLAVIFLKERMFKLQWMCLLVAFIGVAILKGFDSRIGSLALIIILLAAVFSGVVYTLIRKIGPNEDPVVIVNYFMSLSLLVSAMICLFNWITPAASEWTILLSMGVLGFYAQFFMTKAMQREESNQIVPFKYIEVILTILVGWILFGEAMNVISIIAILMIIVALIANVKIKSYFDSLNRL